ncbi:MAG: hypothetical protein PUB76_06785 [Oscillospiraceae bacterium]|nr:hypothetical protein [Oscillospiraceae bacterium]MDD6085663.1 hypothetical protein [Oscillospiraceae bacterium]MDY3258529.1 hypothetical protein [Ruminococcus callidus]
MSIFKRHIKPVQIPKECIGLEIQTQSSICTGERIIGFYDPKTKKLLYSELASTEKDVDAFYKKYGAERKT